MVLLRSFLLTSPPNWLQSPANSIFDANSGVAALPPWKQRALCVLNSIPYLVFSTIVTTIAIFLSDVRLAVTPPSADKFFTVLASLCLVQFAFELVRLALNDTPDCACNPRSPSTSSCMPQSHLDNYVAGR